MIFISDVHDAPGALARLPRDSPLVILGDLVNLTDYRTGQGAVSEVMGDRFAEDAADARGRGEYDRMRELWFDRASDIGLDETRLEIGRVLESQYEAAWEALDGMTGWVLHGNVDRPELLIQSLPDSFEYVHGQVLEIEGFSLGFVGGGVPTPLNAAGEVDDETMAGMLEGMADVDLICTHVPPAVPELRSDVVTGRAERGSEPLYEFLIRHKTPLSLFGDVHQPRASQWRLGSTRCHNAGYFRATGRFLRLRDGVVQVEGISR